MYQLIYTSKARPDINRQELFSLVNSYKKLNEQHNITSILIYSGTTFLHLLEGHEKEVNSTYLNIKNDSNNSEHDIIFKKHIISRSFPNYILEFRETDQATIDSLIILCLSNNENFVNKIDLMTNIKTNNCNKFDPNRLIFFKDLNSKELDVYDNFFEFSTELAADEVFLMKDDAQIVYVNDSACKKLGYTKSELLGLYVWEWDPLFPKEVWPGFFKDFLEKRHIHFQTQHRKKNGEVYPVDIKAHLYQEKGNNYLLAFVNDVSETAKIEKDLLEHKVKLEKIIEKKTINLNKTIEELNIHKTILDTHGAVSITDADGKITYVNSQFTKISGYSQAEIIGKHHNILKSGFHGDDFYHNLYKTLLDNKVWKGEICDKAKNGNIYWIDATIFAQMDENNKPIKFFSIYTDITEKKNDALIIKQNAFKLKAILDNASDGIHIIDNQGNIIECSLAFAESLNYTQEEVLKLKVWDFDVNIKQDEFLKFFIDSSKKSSTIQHKYKTKNNEIIDVEITTRNIELNKQPFIYCSARNVTKRLEEQKKIEILANTDFLTSVANRQKFINYFDEAIQNAKKNNRPISLAYIDIDKFKKINDEFGHTVGDDTLKKLALFLSSCCRKSDLVARIGGDEFTVILENTDIKRASEFKNQIINSNQEIILNNKKIKINYSVGLAIYPKDGQTVEDLIQKADTELYIDKKKKANH